MADAIGDLDIQSNNANEINNAEEGATTKITDINQFCLEHIFSYLALDDLLNVADSNKYLKAATQTPFVRNFGGKSIQFRVDAWKNSYSQRHDLNMKILTPNDKEHRYRCLKEDIVIADLKLTFQMLRNYGGMITTINVDHGSYFEGRLNNERVLFYLYEYCRESLKKLELYGLSGIELLDELGKPFSNVEYLEFSDSTDLNRKCLGKLFPTLRCLRLVFIQENTCSLLSENFPYLMDLDYGYDFNFVNHKNDFATMLQLNQQLRTFKCTSLSLKILDQISEHLQLIECLEIRGFMYEPHENSIHFQNVKHFNIEYKGQRGRRTVPTIPFRFNALKELEINGMILEYSDYLLRFLNDNQMIEELASEDNCLFTLIAEGKLQAALPLLKHFCYSSIFEKHIDVVISNYLPFMEFLSTFSFFIQLNDECDTIMAKLNEICANKWRLSRRSTAIRFLKYDSVVLERIDRTD